MAFQPYINNVEKSIFQGIKTPITYFSAGDFYAGWHRPTSIDPAQIYVNNSRANRDVVVDALSNALVPLTDDWISPDGNTVTTRHLLDNGMYLVACLKKSGNDLSVTYGVTEYNDVRNYLSTGSYYKSGLDNHYFVTSYWFSNRMVQKIGWISVHDTVLNKDFIGLALLWSDSSNVATIKLLDMEYVQFTPYFIDPDYGEPSDEDGYKPNPTGYPSRFDGSSDTIPIPPKPSINISQLGYLNTYKVTASGLTGMINELFPEMTDPIFPSISGDGTLADVANAMSATGNALLNFATNFANSNVLQYVIDTHILPVTPSTSGTSNIKVGYKTLTVSGENVSSDYVDFDCGTVSIGEYYSNFIDYVGTTAQLYLPFVGYVPLKPELFLNGKLKVVYRFNIIDGSFCAFVLSTSSKSKLTDSVIGTYSGNCCVHVPIIGSDFATICSGLVGGVSNALNLASPNVSSVLGEWTGGSIDKVGSTVNSVLPLKGNTSSSNGYNATSSYTGIRYPYLVINRQVADYSSNYAIENGIPLNVTKKLSDVHGYTVCSNPHIDMFCTEEERKMIYDALTTGVIL